MLYSLFVMSRPRFWFYLLGPYLLGLAATSSPPVSFFDPLILWFACYFLWPANLLLYGINDIFDYDTDSRNKKKGDYEQLLTPNNHYKGWISIICINTPFIVTIAFLPAKLLSTSLLFLFLAIFYSAPPLRFKTKPFIDSLSNILYILPGIFGYYLAGGSHISWLVVIAASLWAIAMHAYSAVPDIEADKKANLNTIATFLGKNGTLTFCTILYASSSLIAGFTVGSIAYILGIIYLWLMRQSFQANTHKALLEIYKKFPMVNIGCGMLIFLILILNLI